MKKILILHAFIFLYCGIPFAENSSDISNSSRIDEPAISQNASAGNDTGLPSESDLPSWIHPSYPPYSSKDKVNPFVSFVKVREYEAMQTARKARVEKKSLSPLENLDVSALKLVAILQKDGANLAMVELPDGKGYLIQVGMKIGLYDGVVSSIENDMLIVEEEIVDVFGEAKKRKINLRLRQEKE